MSLDVMKQALRAAEFADLCIKELVTGSTNREVAKQVLSEAITALRAAIEQAQDPELEQAMTDAIIGGTGVMLGDKRIDPASIYKQPEQEPVAWVCYGSASDEKHTIDYQQEDIDAIPVGTMLYTAPRQWQGLTDEERTQFKRLGLVGVEIIEAKLREKNNG